MKIPRSFQVAGKKYKVKWDSVHMNDRGLVGECNHSNCIITLSGMDCGSMQARESVEQVYLHELWHVIWDALGNEKMRLNEQFADSFSSLLQQALNSGKGELT